MQRVFLCLFIFITACTQQGDSLDKKTKAAFLEQLKEIDQENNSSELFRLSDSLLQQSIQTDSTFLTKVFYYKAKAFFSQQKTEEAVKIFEFAKHYFSTQGIHDFNVRSGLYLAICYSDLRAYTEANLMGIQTKNDALRFGDPDLISAALESLSYVAYKNHNHQKALSYMHESEAFHEKNGNEKKLSTSFNNLGILYQNIGDDEKAQLYHEKALNLNLKNKDATGVAKSHSNIGLLAEKKGDYPEAIRHYSEAIQINNKNDLINPIPVVNLAHIYFKLESYDQSKKLFTQAIKILHQKSDLKKLKEVYESLLSIGEVENNILEIQQYTSLIYDLELEIELNEAAEREVMLKKQGELLQQKLILESKQTNAKITQFSLFTVLVLLVMIIFFFIQRFKNLRSTNERNAMALELKVLRSQMNPHFIFNTLTSIQNQMLSNNTIASAHSISRFAKLIRQNFEFTSKNEITLNEDIDALENYLATQQMRYGQKFSYTISIDNKLKASKILIPPMLLQPFVENAIEHGFKNISYKGNIEVSVKKLSPYLIQFSIVDNGVGYTPKSDNSLHAIDIIKKRLRLNEAGLENSFQIKSLGKNKGTQVTFNLYTKLNENINNRR